MYKQILINKYFHKLCKEKFFKNDEDAIIGSAKDVIQFLKENIEYVNNKENNVGEEWAEFITTESNDLIQDINRTYKKKMILLDYSIIQWLVIMYYKTDNHYLRT